MNVSLDAIVFVPVLLHQVLTFYHSVSITQLHCNLMYKCNLKLESNTSYAIIIYVCPILKSDNSCPLLPGFGHDLAKRLDELGFTVLAACLDPVGDGAKTLLITCSKRLHVIGLDVSRDDSVATALVEAEKIVKKSQQGDVIVLFTF